MKPLKVLSIDFDYFQDVSLETMLNCYPDGIDLGSAITEITWSSHYAYSYKELMNIKPNMTRLSQLKNILYKQNKDIPVFIANSHIHIYDTIVGYMMMKADCFKGCTVWNIDMHHDFWNRGMALDCGNWVGHILDDIDNSKVIWLARDVSLKAFSKVDLETHTDFKTIMNRKFDLIFICRSDSWLPPHLDVHFDSLVKYMSNNFVNILIEEQVRTPRSMDNIKRSVEQQMQFYRKYYQSIPSDKNR